MENKDYQKYTISTIEGYPQKFRKHLRALFIEKGIAQTDDQMEIGKPSAVSIDGLDLNEQLKKCIYENANSAGVFEEWEFVKDYKYSVLFETENFTALLNSTSTNSQVFDGKECPLFNKLSHPVYKDIDESISLLKFNLKFEAVHPQTTEELFIRYPVVVVFHKTYQIIEIRFDSLKHIFMETPEIVSSILCKQLSKFCIVLSAIKLRFDQVYPVNDRNLRTFAEFLRMRL